MYKHTYTEHAIQQIPQVLFRVYLTDTMPHQNVSKSDVFRKKSRKKANVFPGRNPVPEAYSSFVSDRWVSFASSCEECMALKPLESIIPSQNEANKNPKPSLGVLHRANWITPLI